jgi:outer membrane protein assembly factor BamB
MQSFLSCLLFLVLLLPCAAALQVADLIQSYGRQGGIVVQLGCDDLDLFATLHGPGRFTVQGLDRDAAAVAKARAHLQAEGLYGPVSARRLEGETLPYNDNLINVLVVSAGQGISNEEMMRVLAPYGMVLKREGKGWTRREKGWPEEIDEWTHFLRDASGNAVSSDRTVGPPRRLQWAADTLWGRSHEMNNSFPALVTAKGRMIYIFDTGITGMEDPRLPENWTLIARDAFNGTLLWQRPLDKWGSTYWKQRALRFFGGNMARRLVVDGDRVYCTFTFGGVVSILDADTGKTIGTIPKTEGAEEILVDGDQVVIGSRRERERNTFSAAITCYNSRSGEIEWQVETGWMDSQMTSLGDNEVLYHSGKELVCLERKDGSQRWTFASATATGSKKRRKGKKMLLVAGGKVILGGRGEMFAIDIKTGSLKWKSKGAGGNSMREFDLFYARGQVWCSGDGGMVVGHDIHTGERVNDLDISSVQSQGHHLRCYRAKATEDYLITQFRGVEFISLGGETHKQNDWLRGTCTYGVMPANGFLYAPPHSCFCFAGSIFKGLNAFAGETREQLASRMADAGPGAVEKGPAFGKLAAVETAGDWPAYRHDARRTGATRSPIAAALERRWKIDLKGDLTPPVAGAGRVFVSIKQRHSIVALDALNGQLLWTFAAGARIDSPPTLFKGLLVFGSADGFLYAVRAGDGALAWRRRLAPQDRWLAVEGQLESVWRLHGSVDRKSVV